MDWRIKVLTQFTLAHLPMGECINHRLQRQRARLFGGQDTRVQGRLPETLRTLKSVQSVHTIEGARVIEVGTGWTPVPTILLYLAGAAEIHTYDHVKHVRDDLLHSLVSLLQKQHSSLAAELGLPESVVRDRLSVIARYTTTEEIFAAANIHYHAPADATRSGLEENSVDLYYSSAVLEHMPEAVISEIIREARRTLKSDGIFYALIGLHDHYNGFDSRVSKVNFLKYPEWLWTFFVKNPISYHNRWRKPEFVEALAANGGEVIMAIDTIDPADVERVKTMKLASRFQRFTLEENATTLTELAAKFH